MTDNDVRIRAILTLIRSMDSHESAEFFDLIYQNRERWENEKRLTLESENKGRPE